MSWSPHMEVHYLNTSYPYNSTGSFMEYFEGLTYEHVNFIFDGASHVQQNVYPSMNTSFYKFGASDPGSVSYYDNVYAYGVNEHEPRIEEYRRPLAFENSSTMTNVQTAAGNADWEGNTVTTRVSPVECPRRYPNSSDYQVFWQDNIDPDNMTYEEHMKSLPPKLLELLKLLKILLEELLELGETVGTQSRGLSQELISMLPVSKYKCGFFSRKKSRKERCVVCQMEYKRGDKQITLPCKHIYHASCGTKWLSINKACPICYTEVFCDASKR